MTTLSPTTASRPRQYAIDWLRILAVLLLIYFHTARIYDQFGPFYVKSPQTSSSLSFFVLFLSVWHMPLFFLLSGSATFYALRFRSGGQYCLERFTRIFLPFVFGTLLIAPPQGYYTLLSHPDFHLSYFQYLPIYFTSIQNAGGYRGTFEWAHLWFLLYLFVFSLLSLPLFLYQRRPNNKGASWLVHALALPGGVFLPILFLGGCSCLLRPLWPDTTHALYNDWAAFTTYLLFFIFGYFLCTDESIGHAIDRHLTASGIAAVASLPLLFWWFLSNVHLQPGYHPAFLGMAFVESAISWTWVLFCLGLGRRYLNRTHRWLPYLTQASYPFYILHQTVIVILGFYLLKLGLGIALGFTLITTASLVATLVLYDLCVRRWNVTRFLFGMKIDRK